MKFVIWILVAIILTQTFMVYDLTNRLKAKSQPGLYQVEIRMENGAPRNADRGYLHFSQPFSAPYSYWAMAGFSLHPGEACTCSVHKLYDMAGGRLPEDNDPQFKKGDTKNETRKRR